MPSILFRPKPNVEKTPAALKASPHCCGSLNQLTKSTNMSTALTRVPGTVALSDDEMRRFCSPVFSASQPMRKHSERYSFLPTSSILNGMRENDWVPVRAQEQSVRTEARRGFQKHVVRFARLQHLQSWEKNQVRPEVVLVNSHDKSSAYQLSLRSASVGVHQQQCRSFPMAPSSGSQSNIPSSIPTPLSRLLSKSSTLSLTS